MPKRSISKSSPSAASANEETFDSLAMLDDARGDAASLPTPRQSKRGKTAQRPTPKSEEDGDVADVKHEDLLQALLGGAAISSVVDPILGLYRQQPNEALCVVINLIARASGVNEVEVDAKTLVEGMDVTPLLEELYARVPENSEAYFLVNKEAKYRRFKRSFPDFFTFLMQIAFSADVLLDTVFLPFLLQWLILMSESKSRSFRHTATVALLGIEQGLNRIASDLAQNLSTVRSARDVKVLQKQHHDIVEWRDHIFSQALHQRLRDVAPEIRLGVFQWLKQWVLEFPDDFVENKFLRYFGMALHDKKPEIRMEALDMILLGLARIPDAYNRFHLFLQYFVKRLVEMSGDVDLRCAEMAIRVVALMVRGDHEASEGNELLTDEMVDQVLLSFMDERPTIRTAVGVLFKVFVQCRVTGEDESNHVRASTELLLSFAGTLREQYGEQMPEKYVVDALWSGGKFPAMLSEFHGIIASVESNSPTEVAVALHVVAAMLAKLRNQLVLGPVPKEDRRANASTVRKPTSVEANAASELHQAISKDIGRILAEVLEKHAGEAQVLAAAANTAAFLDLSIFTTQRQTAQLSAIMVALRKWLCTAALATGDSSNETSNALIAAWHALASTEHPLKSEAQAHLAEAVQQVWKQVVAAEKGSSGRNASEEMVARAWERMRILSAVVHFDSHWNNIMDAWHRHADGSTQRPDVMGCIVATAVHTFLWQVGAAAPTMGETPTWPEALLSRGKTLITSTLQLLESTTTAVIERSGTATCWMHLDAFTYLCDLCALRCYDLSQREQELLVSLFEELFRSLGSQLVALQGDLKAITAASGDAASDIAAASSRLGTQRGAYRRVEAIQMRMITGMARLFLLKRMDVAMAPSVLFQWAFTTSKPVSDMFKNCFHSLRERAQDSFGLERDIIVHGYHRCVQVGATPASVEALTFIGNKLSSLHFAATDRYATTTESMVSFGVQFACTTDPLILQAITPYCPRLRMHEAQKIFQQEVRTKELFVNESSAYARAFLTFLRRAAKMEEDGSPASSSRKRGRTISGTVDDVSDDLLSSITNTVPADVAAVWQPSRDSTTTLGKASTRVTSSEGWRVHADEHPAPTVDVHSYSVTPSVSQSTVAKKPRTGATVVSVPSTQESASTVDGLDNEVFIATQEYE